MKLPYNYDHTIERQHIWHVTFVLPKNDTAGRKYGVTMNLAVGGQHIDDAIIAIRSKYPDAVIYAISHGGILLSTPV